MNEIFEILTIVGIFSVVCPLFYSQYLLRHKPQTAYRFNKNYKTLIFGVFSSAISIVLIYFLLANLIGNEAIDRISKYLLFLALAYLLTMLLSFVDFIVHLTKNDSHLLFPEYRKAKRKKQSEESSLVNKTINKENKLLKTVKTNIQDNDFIYLGSVKNKFSTQIVSELKHAKKINNDKNRCEGIHYFKIGKSLLHLVFYHHSEIHGDLGVQDFKAIYVINDQTQVAIFPFYLEAGWSSAYFPIDPENFTSKQIDNLIDEVINRNHQKQIVEREYIKGKVELNYFDFLHSNMSKLLGTRTGFILPNHRVTYLTHTIIGVLKFIFFGSIILAIIKN